MANEYLIRADHLIEKMESRKKPHYSDTVNNLIDAFIDEVKSEPCVVCLETYEEMKELYIKNTENK